MECTMKPHIKEAIDKVWDPKTSNEEILEIYAKFCGLSLTKSGKADFKDFHYHTRFHIVRAAEAVNGSDDYCRPEKDFVLPGGFVIDGNTTPETYMKAYKTAHIKDDKMAMHVYNHMVEKFIKNDIEKCYQFHNFVSKLDNKT